ncbi:MAG TPA: hypothetical protein VFZ09_09300 [Archangium sp.]|uniref:hypothetical protein n=1 Tax=Archangium sp. TaxID=1872627 RepID=UPI002E363C89|nr:hypothetical protein [Archangium sp.]HEX5746430.1 hypothetical protein [Archangium sp.]
MKKSLMHAAVVVASVASLGQAQAAPMSPAARPVAQNFSALVQENFTLMGDTDDPFLIYYVPRRGGVAVDSAASTSPIPRFNISAFYPTFGFWAGLELSRLGGTLSTTSYLGELQRLQNEAASKGLYVAPAPASKAKSKFLITGYEVDGRIDVSCTKESIEIIVNGVPRTVQVPNCFTRQNPDEPYALDTNVMYKFASTGVNSGSVVAQDISFQATTLPDYVQGLRDVMTFGGQWDNLITAKVDWEIKTSNLTRQARLHVNWQTLFEQASSYASIHLNSCLDVEVKAFFQRVVQCNKEAECGIRIEYLVNGVWVPTAPNDANFVNVVNAVERQVKDELFNEVRKYTTPVNGQVSDERSAIFTLRANYEKLMMSKNEVINVTYNPGPTDVTASTTLNISCLMGGFESGRVTWNMADPGCVALLGQENP